MTVSLVNQFDVRPGRDDVFLGLWRQVNGYMRAQPGYLGHALHRATTPGPAGRYVTVAEWASEDELRAAHDGRFRFLVSRPEWAQFPLRPAVYEVVDTGRSSPGW